MVVDLSNAVVVHVPAISHKICVMKEVTLDQTTFKTTVGKHFSYIVTYPFISPLKAFEGISGRYKLSQMSLKQHSDRIVFLVVSFVYLFLKTRSNFTYSQNKL